MYEEGYERRETQRAVVFPLLSVRSTATQSKRDRGTHRGTKNAADSAAVAPTPRAIVGITQSLWPAAPTGVDLALVSSGFSFGRVNSAGVGEENQG